MGEQLEESEVAEKTPYPLMTWVSSAGQFQTLRLPQEEMPTPRTVLIELCITDDLLPDQTLCERMIEAARRGALVGVVCNLVANAQDLARKLREKHLCKGRQNVPFLGLGDKSDFLCCVALC